MYYVPPVNTEHARGNLKMYNYEYPRLECNGMYNNIGIVNVDAKL